MESNFEVKMCCMNISCVLVLTFLKLNWGNFGFMVLCVFTDYSNVIFICIVIFWYCVVFVL